MGIPRACSVCWFFHVLVLVCFLCQILYVGTVVAQTAQLTVDASPQNAQTIPGNMFGIFFEVSVMFNNCSYICFMYSNL
jgi:alpha-N-arabinofuranosidase